MNTLAERLKKARAHAEFTQPQLEDRSGVSQRTISKIELGKQAKSTQIVQLARACGVRPEWLGAGDGPMEPETAKNQTGEARASYEILSTEALEIARAWQELPPASRASFRQAILLESAIISLVGERALGPRPREFTRDYLNRLTKLLRQKGEEK